MPSMRQRFRTSCESGPLYWYISSGYFFDASKFDGLIT